MSKNKKILVILIILLAVLVLILMKSQVKNESQIVIGAPLPLSGNTASLAERVKTAMEIGLSEATKDAKFEYKLQFEDTKGEAPTAISAVRKLMDVDGAKVFVGLLKSDALLGVAPVTEEDKAVVVSPTAGAAQISDAGDYVFRTIEGPDTHGEFMTDFLVKQNVERVAVFTAQASNAQSYGNSFKDVFERKGEIVVDTEYQPTNTDFRAEIAKVNASNVDGVYVAVATAKDGGLIVRQLREQGFSEVIALSVAAEAQEFFDAAGEFAEGVYITASFYDKNDSRFSDFREQFLAKAGGREADGFSANGYDSVVLIVHASEYCGGVSDTDCIRDYLYSVENHIGLGGTLSFDQNGDVQKPVVIKESVSGEFMIVN